jgi:NAD(P)-dependent dehydrogenase (short-subunit alcohol dehydrogenase family)
VFGCDLKSDEDEETCELVRKAGGQMQSMHGYDVSDMENARRWTEGAVKAFGGIDILYNNAGKLHGRVPFGEMTIEDWDLAIRYELTIVFACSRAAWPHLVARGGGVIINTASVSGHFETYPLHAPVHGTTKAAVMGFTRMLAAEGANFNIRAVSISPGLIRTPATERMWTSEDEHHRAIGMALMGKIPMKRPGECEEIAKAAVFLASADAAYINGTDLCVDGGWKGVSYAPFITPKED